MTKILQLTAHGGFGGAERVMFDLIKGLKGQFEVVAVLPPGIFLEKIQRLGVQAKQLENKGGFGVVNELSELIRQEKPNIVHCHSTRAAFWARLAVLGSKNKPRLIYTPHGFHLPRKRFFISWPLLLAESWLNQLTDCLVCVSEAERAEVFRYKTHGRADVRVIKNGIDLERFKQDTEEVRRQQTGLNLDNKFVITSVGRLHYQKDFLTIFKAIRLIGGKINCHILVVGDGPLRNSLENEVEEMDLKNQVTFMGGRDDVPVLMHLSDIIILSTNWEGLPLVPLEAGACAKPVIASDVDGVREVVLDGKTGFLFKPGSAEDLAEKILKLAQSQTLREQVGAEAFKFVSENFGREKMIESYKKLYESW